MWASLTRGRQNYAIHHSVRSLAVFGLVVATSGTLTARAQDSFPVSIRVDAGAPLGELKPIWRFFGADEPNYATMKNGQKLIGELGELRPKQVFFRTHNLLCTGDGTPALKWGSTNAYSRGRRRQSNLRLDDSRPHLRHVSRSAACGRTCRSASCPRRCRPSRSRISTRGRRGRRYDEIYTGWAYPPKDYDKWGELVYQWTKHCVERYGREEVETWYWEIWNEANIGYWRGTPEEFFKLHDYAIAGVRRALPTAKVGGADTAGSGGRFTRRFLEHCLRGTNYATGENGHAARLRRRSTPRARRPTSTATCAWASPTSSARSTTAFASSPRIRN